MAKPAFLEDEAIQKEASQGSFEFLKAGGHRCFIREIQLARSKSSNFDMYVIHFDTAPDDVQPGYFLNAYVNSKRLDKVWPGRHWYIVDEMAYYNKKDGGISYYGRVNLAKFVNAIEDSNEGFEIDWTHDYNTQEFLEQFKNKKIGIVFRWEDYTDATTGEARMSVKALYYRDINGVEDAKVPARKEQQTKEAEGFMHIDDDLEGIPFNN